MAKTVKQPRTLNIKLTTKKEVQEKWNTLLPFKWPETLYIRCNAKGDVNWDAAPVFQPQEIIERGNYKVHS